MKILLASVDRPDDPNAWSGTPHQVYRALLEAGHEVHVLTGLSTTRAPWHLAARLLLGKDRYLLWMTGAALRKMGRRLEEAERSCKPDLIVGIAAQFLVYANPVSRFVLFSDAPWSTFRSGYAPFNPNFPIRSGWYEQKERRVARRAWRLVYTSEWAKSAAVEEFGIDAADVRVVALGANWVPQEVDQAIVESLPTKQDLRLLFVGRDWLRKGGDLAVEVVRKLRADGVNAQLDVVGVDAAQVGLDHGEEGVTVIGRTIIDELDPGSVMRARFQACHFVLVPSRAECFGIIFAEAAAFGRPAVALDVDAVGEVVLHEETGLLFPIDASPRIIAERILSCIEHDTEYERLSRFARTRHEAVLNWSSFGSSFSRAISDVR